MQAEEALRHDWFKDLLIEMEKQIDINIAARGVPLSTQMDED
jgi:hypothetical protein